MTKICVAAYVAGRVQGVGFRYSTQMKAQALNLTGYAYNMDDGRVEVVAEGEPAQVELLLEWLRNGGPRSASVEQVHTEPRPPQGFSRFQVRH